VTASIRRLLLLSIFDHPRSPEYGIAEKGRT
jgi:hypothetical protein